MDLHVKTADGQVLHGEDRGGIMNPSSQSWQDWRASERDLPPIICRAMQRVTSMRDGPFADITGLRELLCEIVRCADRRFADRPITVHRQTLAIRLDISLATLARRLARLVDLGWLQREQSMHKARQRGFQVAKTLLTRQAINWLGFNDEPDEPNKALCGSPLTHACGDSIQSLQEPTAGALTRPLAGDESPSTPKPSTATSSQQPQGEVNVDLEERSRRAEAKAKGVPADLMPLLAVFEARQVFSLMGIAAKTNRRGILRSIWSLNAALIEKARKPFGYVRSLILMDRDWDREAGQGACDQSSTRPSWRAKNAGTDNIKSAAQVLSSALPGSGNALPTQSATASKAASERVDLRVDLSTLTGNWYLSLKTQSLYFVDAASTGVGMCMRVWREGRKVRQGLIKVDEGFVCAVASKALQKITTSEASSHQANWLAAATA